MSEDTRREQTRARKRYTRPVVKRVHLKPDEAVLGGCKINGKRGPVTSNCGVPTPCNARTS